MMKPANTKNMMFLFIVFSLCNIGRIQKSFTLVGKLSAESKAAAATADYFPIVGARIQESTPECFVHGFFLNPKPAIANPEFRGALTLPALI
jgi:hypothetical protein